MRNNRKILSVLESQGYSFSFFTEADIAAHKDFVARNFPGTVTRSNYNYNKWKYGGREDGINLLLCKKDSHIIGQIGYISARISISNQIHDCVWGCNFKVEERYKELGIGAALEIYASGVFPVILGLSPSTESIRYKRSLGFKLLEGPRIMMFPVKADHVLRLKAGGLLRPLLPVANVIATPVLQLILALRFSDADSTGWQDCDERQLAQRIAVKEEKLATPHIVHDAAFLLWRCNLPKEFRDKARMVINTFDDSSYAVYSISGKILHLYDFSFSSPVVLRSLMKRLIRVRGISTIRVLANKNEEEQMLKRTGFIPLRRKGVVTAYSNAGLFSTHEKMLVTGYDGDTDL